MKSRVADRASKKGVINFITANVEFGMLAYAVGVLWHLFFRGNLVGKMLFHMFIFENILGSFIGCLGILALVISVVVGSLFGVLWMAKGTQELWGFLVKRSNYKMYCVLALLLNATLTVGAVLMIL